jgi:hypothetical protein
MPRLRLSKFLVVFILTAAVWLGLAGSAVHALQLEVDPRVVGRDQDSWFETAAAFAIILQAFAVIGGGIWGFYLYRHGRRGQVRVGVRASARLHRDWSDTHSVLLVRLRVANVSGVLYRHREATATLMDARKPAADGTVRLVPFSQADPILPVYADISDDGDEIAAGRTFLPLEEEEVELEPGENLESEVAFPVRNDKLGLMAVRLRIEGYQGRRGAPFWWGTFLYVDPDELGERFPEPGDLSTLETP